MAAKFPLRELIEVVTSELRTAAAQTYRRDAVMQFEECELEMAIDIEKNASGGINVWVVQLGGGAKKTDSNTIRVKFKAISGNALAFPVVGDDDVGPELGRKTK